MWHSMQTDPHNHISLHTLEPASNSKIDELFDDSDTEVSDYKDYKDSYYEDGK